MSVSKSLSCSCIVCKKEYSTFGIDTHYYRMHGPTEIKTKWKSSAKLSSVINTYNENPNTCKNCNAALSYAKRKYAYCSRSCSATCNNKSRQIINIRQKQLKCTTCNVLCITDARCHRTRCSLCVKPVNYTKIRIINCKFCKHNFCSTKRTLVCNNCQHKKWNNNKDAYSFKFNVYEYPDIFDLNYLNKVGWFYYGGNRKKRISLNPNGLTKDHKVSINDAKINNYDPYYISHVLNCELITMEENLKKGKKSSMEYNILVKIINEYDLKCF